MSSHTNRFNEKLTEILQEYKGGNIRTYPIGKAKQAIRDLILSEIGEDEYSGEYSFDTTPVDEIRNELRAELRNKILKGE